MSQMSGTNRAARPGGGMIFASAVLMIAGAFQVLMGIVALVNRGFFFAVGNTYTYRWGLRDWGIVHVVVGGVMLLTAIALLTGARMTRSVGVAVAALAAIASFFFIPYYPIWSILTIALDVFVIWSLSMTHVEDRMGGERRMMETAAPAGDRWTSTNQAGYNTAEPMGRRSPDRSDQLSRGDAQREQQPSSGRQPGA